MNEQFRPKTNYAETEMTRILASVRNSGLPIEEQNAKLQQIFKSYGIDWKIPADNTQQNTQTITTPHTVQAPRVAQTSFNQSGEFFKTEQERISARLLAVPEEERAELLKTILLNEYGITAKEVQKLNIDQTFVRSLLGGTAFAGVALAVVLNFNTVSNFVGDIASRIGKAKNAAEKFVNPRFNEQVYESLPAAGKEIYKLFAENNPTPGRGYMFLDKEAALEYVFNKDNILVATVVAGFGQQAGDATNTSVNAGYN